MNIVGRTLRAVSLALVFAAFPVAAQTPPGETFEHPERRYSLPIPADARARHPGGNVDIAIDSDKGFGVILQSAAVRPGASISEMAATLEAAYLGPDKAWRSKVGQHITLLSGLVAFNGYYAGNGARYRVVITRGQINTYTFVFRAREKFFEGFEKDFDKILQDFKPAPGDMPSPPAQVSAEAPAQEKPAAAEDGPAVRKFGEWRLGYSIEYDADWIFERPSPEAIMFSGPEGTEAFFATVSIQNVAPPNAETSAQAASMIMDDIRVQFEKDAVDVVFEGDGPYIYRKGDVFILGHEFSVSYSDNQRRFKQWSLVLPRSDGRVAHIWSYRAPIESFARHLQVARNMVQSWTIMDRKGEADEEPVRIGP
ncbi:MAG: hypothetical protein HN403_02300 [Rhodospirillales bacterium]|jgi:hypothetical protein|nr:hypothetical protein [Rhodospirillales bacterium]